MMANQKLYTKKVGNMFPNEMMEGSLNAEIYCFQLVANQIQILGV